MTEPPTRAPGARWLGLLLGAASLSAVVAVAVAWGDRARFQAIVAEAEPSWLVLALAFQAATYLMPAAAWAAVLRAAGRPLPLRHLYSLALVQLFTNQALPVAGLAGLVVVVAGFDRRGVGRPTGLAAMLVDQLGFLLSNSLTIAVALAWFGVRGALPPVLLGAGLLGIALGVAFGGILFWLTSPGRALPGWLARWKRLSEVAATLLDADHALVRRPGLLAWATLVRTGNVALDVLTTWACLRAVGQHVAVGDAAAAFVVGSLGRTMGGVPGGVGTYEAGAITGLVLLDVPIETALAATLLFRLGSFWLPMIPGLILGSRLGLMADRQG